MIFYSALKAFVLLQDPLVYAYLKLNPFMQGDVAVLPFDDVLFVSAFVHCSRHVMENSLFCFELPFGIAMHSLPVTIGAYYVLCASLYAF